MTYITNEHIVEELRAHNRWRCGGDGPATDARRLTALIDAACDAIERATWRDISTAPRDGSEFQAWVVVNGADGMWELECTCDAGGTLRDKLGFRYDAEQVTVTHWMPKPSAPTPRPA